MSTDSQSEIYEELNNTEETIGDRGTVEEKLTSEFNSEFVGEKKKPEMKLTQSDEMDSLNHIGKAVITKENQQNCDTNHDSVDDTQNHNTSADDMDNADSVNMDNADSEVGDTNNSNSMDGQPYPEGVSHSTVYMSPQCNHMPTAPLAAQTDGHMYPSATSPTGIGHSQQVPHGTMHSPQMATFGPNGGSVGPNRQHQPAHGGLQFSTCSTPPQSGASTPNTMNNGNQGTGHQHVVHVHINAGERFTFRVDDQIQHIEGKASFRYKLFFSMKTKLSVMFFLKRRKTCKSHAVTHMYCTTCTTKRMYSFKGSTG